ncbi:aggregation factor core [Pseudaestuariivita sp.]|uniref:aggregation factor core n=1 Tax=Pseudaestuariivita sp. TaxID=2211669 RepID=UPI0040595BCB
MADVVVSFRDGAPKDRFEVANVGDCDLGAGRLALDFAGSAGGLIFDVTDRGAGVEVFQPFEIVEGAEYLDGFAEIADGDSFALLEFSGMPAGARFAFTIDVDDTGGGREITVSGSEIAGATATWTQGGMDEQVSMATFGADGSARIVLPGCGT